jgi:hypothetical protein
MMQTEKFPVTVSQEGVLAKIRKFSRIKNGKTYTTFAAEYFLLGKRKQEWRSSFDEAETVALEACRAISRGQQVSLTLANGERLEYLRANEAVTPMGVKLDVAAHEYAGAMTLLGGRATITEACRAWLKQNDSKLPTVAVSQAVNEIVQQAKMDGKSAMRLKQLFNVLNRFAESFNIELQDISPALISQYLARLPLADRSRRNHRDVIKFFNRFCVLRGYLKKGTDWLEGVQKYSARKFGAIEIYSPDEMKIEISDQAGDSFIAVRSIKNTKSDQRRRLVPIKDNLKAWLLPYRKTAGEVCPFKNISKQLLKLATKVGMKWKKNALRHSCISYRVAECKNVPLVSGESGNSVYVVHTYYLRHVKPSVAAEWFGIMPA